MLFSIEQAVPQTIMVKGLLSAAIVILIWGMTFASTRALLFEYSSLEIQVLRFALAWVALWVICPKRMRLNDRKDEWLFAAMGLTGVFIYQFLENCAIYYTNASNVAILVSFGPIVTAALARMFTKDRSLSLSMFLGSLVSIIGVAIVSLNGVVNFHLRPLGDLMALVAMISWGVYSILIDKANEKGYSPMLVIRRAFFWAIVFMLPLLAWGATDSGFYAMDGSFSVTLDAKANIERFMNPMNWINLGFLGVFASALCFVLWNAACKSLGVVKATIGLYLTPIIGVVFAALFLGETITIMEVVGGTIIIAGVALANKKGKENG